MGSLAGGQASNTGGTDVSQNPLSPEDLQRMKEAQLARGGDAGLADVVHRNIAALVERRHEFERTKSLQDRVADVLTAFSGSMLFLYFHALWFGLWVAINLGWLGIKPFDPFPFGLLTMIVSLEAIFLSTFVLISQNRSSFLADKRADLDLQINLLAEHEITRILTLVDAMAERMGIEEAEDAEMEELERNVAPEAILDEMRNREREQRKQARGGKAGD
jgi:uncharacterized membrane protein